MLRRVCPEQRRTIQHLHNFDRSYWTQKDNIQIEWKKKQALVIFL